MPQSIEYALVRRLSVALLGCLALTAALASATAESQAPQLDKTERERAKQMLKDIERSVRDNYYDKSLGAPLDPRTAAQMFPVEWKQPK